MKTFNFILTLVSITLFSSGLMAQTPGTFNNNFGSSGYQWYDVNSKNQYGFAIATQPDGKILIGGIHEHTNDKYDWIVYRLKTNGMLDNTFGSNGKYSNSFSDQDYLTGIGVQSNGKIIICGYSDMDTSSWDIIVHRLNADGTLDNTFGNSGTVQLDRSIGQADAVKKMIVGPNDEIYLGGYMQISGDAYFLVHKLLPNGDPDSSFSLDGSQFVDMDDDGIVNDMVLADDGSIFLCGNVDGGNNGNKMAILKIKPNGHFDNSFAGDGIKLFQPGIGQEGYIFGITALPDGSVMGVGMKDNASADALVMKLTPTGLLDGTFNGNGFYELDLTIGAYDYFKRIERLANGKYLALAETKMNNIRKGRLYQLNADGSIDGTAYANGTGHLDISISSGSEFVSEIAVNNNFAYTIGNFDSGLSDDIFVTSSHLYNPVGISEQPLTSTNMTIFPNPVNSGTQVQISLDDEIKGAVEISIVSMTGQTIYYDSFYKMSEVYDHKVMLESFTPGIYLVKVNNGNRVGAQKLIIH